MFKTELGNSLLDKPFNAELAALNGVYIAVLTDSDMHCHESEPFAPSSATEFFLWKTEVQSHARLLGHHVVEIFHEQNGKRRSVAKYARYRGGVEWQHFGIVAETEIIANNRKIEGDIHAN